jgi:PAS domain S-box-containing protein
VAETINVLLFEDNPADVLLLQEALGKDALHVYSLTVVERLAQGLALLGQASFDLALLDLGLPDSWGLETFERLHRLFPDLPVVVLSGNKNEQDAVRAVRLGAQDYLVKGVGGREMVERAIRYALLRQQAQEELQQERRRLAQIAATVPGVICTFRMRPDGSVCMPYASPAIEQVYGVRPEDVAQDFSIVMNRLHPQDIGHVLQTIAESARSLQPWHDEYRYQHPEKGEVWIAGHSMPTRQPDGGYQWHGFIMDVTAYRQAERDIRQGAEKLRLVFESTQDILFMVDREYRLVMSNQAYQQALRAIGGRGMSPGDPVLGPEYPQAYRDLWQGYYDRALAGESFMVETELPWQDSMHYLENSLAPVRSAEGTVEGVLVVSRDITLLKAAQAELQELNRSLEQRVEQRTAEVQDLYDNAPCGYHSLDLEGRFVHINDTELKWLGYTREELLGRPFLDFATPETRQVFYQNYPRFKQQGWINDLEFELVRKDGSCFPILVSATAIYDAAGNYLMSRSTVQDITARRRAEQALRQRSEDLAAANAALEKAARLKDEFLASMSHELRTPLTGILGLAEALQYNTYGGLNPRQLNALKNIETSGRHLLDLINDILDLSKIEAGKLELHIETCSLVDVCQASLQLTRGMAQQKRQVIRFSMSSSTIQLYADPRRLKQMLVNLLSNAVKFTPAGGELGMVVEGVEKERVVRVSVWDKGIGIPPEDLERLFQPFVQLDSSLSRQYSGTGLGLSLVQRLAMMHGGGVQVESTPGQGSCFTLILPWAAPGGAALEQPELDAPFPLPSAGETPLRVLAADDNETVVNALADFLRTQGCEVTAVNSGEELLERAAEEHPQVVLVDIQMPGMDGLEVMRRLRLHPDPAVAEAPIIAITALAMPGDRQRCLEAGANEYLSKPLRLPYLLEVMRRLHRPQPPLPGG